MLPTNHLKVRCQQRGISKDQVDIIVTYGRKIRRPGGAWKYILHKRDKDRIISMLKNEIQVVEKSTDTAVIVCDGAILTTYHAE